MKASRIAKLLIFNMLVLLTLYPIGSAMAVRPDTTTSEYDVSGEWIAFCDGFEVLANSHQKYVETIYYDKNGEIKNIQVHLSVTDGIVYNSEDPSRWIPEGPDHIRYTIDPVSGLLTQTGLALHVTVPGYGIIGINAGRIILIPEGDIWDWEVVWDKGQNDFLTGDLDALCSYLAVP